MPGVLPSQVAGAEDPVQVLTAPALDNIRQLSALDTVRGRIALAVELGLLAPGERLPPHDQIAEALGVGDITVRRALAALAREGLLERRRGRSGGTLVAERPTQGTVDATDAYRTQAGEVHRLIDQRLVLECGIAHLAAGNSTDSATLRRIDDLVEKMDQAASWAEFHRHDERFHLAVAAATGIPSIVEPYRAVLRELYRYYLPYPIDALRQSNRDHRALAVALRQRDSEAGASVAQRHVADLHRTMFVGLIDPDTSGTATGSRKTRSG